MMMKNPDSRSCTTRCAPKPSAAPITVAGATSDPTGMSRTSVICTMHQIADAATIDTQEITDATAWRCLALSERTSASLSRNVGVERRAICCGDPVDEPGRQHRDDQHHGTIRRPRVMIQSPMLAAPEVVPALRRSSIARYVF